MLAPAIFQKNPSSSTGTPNPKVPPTATQSGGSGASRPFSHPLGPSALSAHLIQQLQPIAQSLARTSSPP